MATCSGILAWKSPWTEEPGGLQSVGPPKKSDTTEQLNQFQYFGHLMQIVDSLEKILSLGKIEGKRRRGQQRIR